MALLLGRSLLQPDGGEAISGPDDDRLRWLLVGGPGSGKSTLTTMVAQALRLPWVERQVDALPEQVHDTWQRARERLARLAEQGDWTGNVEALPLRVNLPAVARWMAPRGDGVAVTLWDYLAARLVDDLGRQGVSTEMSAHELRAMAEKAGTLIWILDGLDEVPPSAGRGGVIRVVRATVCDGGRSGDGVIVSTRPQGYEGEFDDLDPVDLLPLPAELALEYAERLVRAWSSGAAGADLEARLEKMRGEFAKPEVEELIQTPLHTTMAALLASRGSLSSARSVLFEHYFTTILKRELGKPFDHGIQDVEEPVIRALHARAGLALQVRSQAQSGARSSLRRRELRAMLTAIYTELGNRGDDVQGNVDRIMRFAAERLVLLLHAAEGEYEFGVRSLQEFFAAEALGEAGAEAAVVRARLDAIVLDPHWSNVLAFVVSSQALKASKADHKRALLFTVALCRALNAGELGGEAAARCFMGSRLAVAMLRETERYGYPWLHDPLWDIALEAAASPVQSDFAGVAREAHAGRLTGAWSDDIEIHTRLGLLAAKWARTDVGARRQRLMERAESLLAQGSDDAVKGWRLLHGLLSEEVPEAIRIAEACQPTTAEEAREIFLGFARELGVPMPSWFYAFAEQHLAWFSPGTTSFRLYNHRQEDGPFTIQKRFRRTTLTWRGGAQEILHGNLTEIGTNASYWNAIEPLMRDETPALIAWKRVVQFMAAPSPSSLGDVLDAAQVKDAFNDLRRAHTRLPWPILACLRHAQSSAELHNIATMTREGQLGSAEDWRAAEARWRASQPIPLDDVGIWLEADGAWNNDIASRGSVALSWFVSPSDSDVTDYETFSWLTRWIESHSPPPRNAIALLRPLLRGDLMVPLGVARFCDRWSTAELLPDLTRTDAESWFSLLDERGRTDSIGVNYIASNDVVRTERVTAIMQALTGRVRERPDQWGLLNAVKSLLYALPDHDLSTLTLPVLPEDVPPHTRATYAFLLLLSGPASRSEIATRLTQMRFENGAAGADFRGSLARIFRSRTRTTPDAIPLLLAALDSQPPPERALRDALLGALYAQLRRTLTPAFASPEAWQSHDLPAPHLAALPPPPPPPRLLRITELTSIRLFRDTPTVDVPFPVPDGERGQWIVLVGENGVGKTTILRALALTLAAPSVASKLLDEQLRMARNGSEGRVSIDLDTGNLSIALRRVERTELVESLSPPDVARPWVVGYGVRRGNARGEKDREPETGPVGELHTLFDRPASLHNAVKWLKDLDADVLREQRRGPRSPDAPPGPREGVWRSVQRALHELLGVTRVEVDDSGVVHVVHPKFERVRLDALSDGYLTTAGWVIDMIARWISRQDELDEPVGADVLRQMCGFVLLDEVDLHLHPMWQLQILTDVRRLFPRLSFVVTTHNPLTLQGARPGEVYVVRRDGARIELVQRNIRPGHDVDRVLFEQFGVEHTFDRETRDLLARHREMLERGIAPDDPRRTEIEGELRARFGDAGEALRDQRGAERGPVVLRPEERHLLTPFLEKKA